MENMVRDSKRYSSREENHLLKKLETLGCIVGGVGLEEESNDKIQNKYFKGCQLVYHH